MGKAYFKPWIGGSYSNTKVLVLSESAYSWPDGDGNIVDPPPSHPTKSLLHWTHPDRFGKQRYFTAMSSPLRSQDTYRGRPQAGVERMCLYDLRPGDSGHWGSQAAQCFTVGRSSQTISPSHRGHSSPKSHRHRLRNVAAPYAAHGDPAK